MRKVKTGVALLLCMIMVVGTMVTHASGSATISSFSAAIDKGKVVKIEGDMDSGGASIVGVRILSTDPDHYPYTYVNSVHTEENGHFSIIYTMSDAAEGVTYAVTVRATDTAANVYAVENTSFVYSAAAGDVAVTEVALNKNTASITAGANETLTATVTPAGATNKNVSWTSSDNTVATVDAAGKVTGIKAGTATITVTTADGGKTAACVVTVKAVNSGVNTSTGITEDKTKVTLEGNIARVTVSQTFDKDLGRAQIKLDSTTLTNAFSKAIENDDGTKRIEVDISETAGANSYQATMPVEFLGKMVDNQVVLINSNVASMAISANFLDLVQDARKASNISVVFGEVNKSSLSEEMNSILGDRKAIEINIMLDGINAPVSSKKSTLLISVPYTPTAADLENPEYISVWCIDNGEEEAIPNARYDAATGVVTFETPHLSKFAVGSVYKTFDDLSNFGWAKKSIEILYSKGIIGGTSATTFSPAKNITRAEFITSLIKTLGLRAEGNSSFEDVKATDYYYEAVCIAKELGITNGASDKFFRPNAEILRQDMMVMTKLAMVAAGKIDNKDHNISILNQFKDTSNISKYAADSIAALINEGIVSGSSNKINPKNYATRAEEAALLYNVYNK